MKIIWFLLSVCISICTTQIDYPDYHDYEPEQKPVTGFEAVKILFAADLYKQLGQLNNGNFLVSPLSLQILLGLLHSGASGITAAEIATAIRMPNNADRIQREFQKIMLDVLEPYTLITGNKIYFPDILTINENYKAIAQNVFKSEVDVTNFRTAKQAAAIINKWVEERTENNIKDLLSESDLGSSTVTVLINTIYFNAKWIKRFDKAYTKPEIFYTDSGEEVIVDMMNNVINANYYHNEQLQAHFLELPYEGEEVAMTIVLPERKGFFPVLETYYREILVRPPYTQYRKTTVGIKIPKFQIKSSINLNDVLYNLGIKSAFTQKANFSGITDSKNIFISKSIQKTLIKVVEGGTTAAAASLSELYFKSAPTRFFANHPFIFILRHNQHGILFLGRYTNPAGTEIWPPLEKLKRLCIPPMIPCTESYLDNCNNQKNFVTCGGSLKN